MSWEATLYSTWACAGGTAIADLSPIGAESEFEETLDASAPLVLTLDDSHFDACARRRVIRLTLEDGEVREWRIEARDRRIGAPTFRLEALPPLYDLRTAGLIRQRVGTRLLTAFDESGTVDDFLRGPFSWNLTADGLGWIDIGAVEFADTYRLAWQRLNRFEFLQRLRAETRGEVQLRRVGETGYALDVVRAIGADAPLVRARFGDNLLTLSERVPDGDVVTVLAPFGVAEGDVGAYAGPNDNAWRVAAVTVDAAGDWLELRDPATTQPPLLEDDQLVGFGLTWQGGGPIGIIGGDAALARVQIATSGSAPSVGTMVTLCQDASGAPLETLSTRIGLAESGPVVADLEVAGARGERNRLANPNFTEGLASLTRTGGDAQPWGVYAVTDTVDLSGALSANANISDTAISVSGFPANATLRVGEFVEIIAATLTSTGTARVDAAGETTLTLSAPTPFTLTDGTVLQLRGPLGEAWGSAVVDGTQSAGVTSLALRALQPETNVTVGTTTARVSVESLTSTLAAYLNLDLPRNTATSCVYLLQFPYGGLAVPINDSSVTRTVRWSKSGLPVSGTVIDDYVANGTVMAVRVTQTMFWSGVAWQPFEFLIDSGFWVLTHDNSRTSPARTITAASGWDGSRRQTLTVGATWDIAPTNPSDGPDTTRRLELEGGVLQAVTLVGDPLWASAGTTVTVESPTGYLGRYVPLIAASSTLASTGQTCYVRTQTTLDGSGAGSVPVSTLGAASVSGAVVRTRRCPSYLDDAESGGPRGPQVLYLSGAASAQELRWPQVTIVVPAGETVMVIAKVWLTLWSPLATGSVPALLRLTDGSWTTIEQLAPDPDPTPIPADAGRGLPEYRTLTIEHVLSSTTTLGLAVRGGGAGLGPHQCFVRGAMLTVGTDAAVPFTPGSFANVLIHTALDELARAGRPVPRYEASLAAWDQAVAPVPDLAPGLLPRLTLGGRVLLEDVRDPAGQPRLVRLVGARRVPSRADARLTLGTLDRRDLAFTVGRGVGTIPGGR